MCQFLHKQNAEESNNANLPEECGLIYLSLMISYC